MKNIIIDSNILFKAFRGKNSTIRDKLYNPDVNFYAPNFLVVEIFKHKERIVKASKIREGEVYELLEKILQRINFVNEEFISTGNLIHAYKLCAGIDGKDTLFVALTIELNGKLWTHDEILKIGLKRKGFNSFFDEI